jgi:NHLM bacteriocin system ABC transporter ATP-binding protein
VASTTSDPHVTEMLFLLRVVATSEARQPEQETRVEGPVTIGRDPGCSVVLTDPSVSRKHARVESAGAGVRVVDLGSGNGVWVGTNRVAEALITPGQQFRIGSTVFECDHVDDGLRPTVEMPAGASQPESAEASPPDGCALRVVYGGESVREGTIYTIDRDVVTLGRATSCDIILSEKNISRQHARLERTADGLRVIDLNSQGGIWMGNDQVASVDLKTGDQVRIGHQIVLECLASADQRTPEQQDAAPPSETPVEDSTAIIPPRARPLSDETRMLTSEEPGAASAPLLGASDQTDQLDFSETIVMPAPASLLARTRRVEDEGELIEASAHHPFLLDDPESLWYVVTGGLLVFTVALERGQPVGSRSHFLGVTAGQCCFGFDLRSYALGSGFLAVAKQGTMLRRIPVSRIRELASVPQQADTIAALVDTWLSALSKALARDISIKRAGEQVLEAGQPLTLDRKSKATASDGVLWVELWSGSILFDDVSTPLFPRKRALFPVTPDSWIRPVGEEFGDLTMTPRPTIEVVQNPAFWHSLAVFHQVLCECQFVAKKLATADEYIRLQQKARHQDAAEEAAYDAIGAVMRTEAVTPREFLDSAAKEPVLKACTLVGNALGVEVMPHPAATEDLTYEEMVSAIATASGFRTRVVALRDDWWNHDHSAMLGQISEGGQPVALLPVSASAYVYVDPKTGRRAPVTEAVAARLSPFAYTFYRPFPDGPPSAREVIRFATRGVKSDIKWLIITGIAIGVFGTATPYLTGQLFDSAIPQADRAALWVFGLALFLAALAGSLFKLTQGVATVRIQARMESALQTAVWDRLLNLPANFFRRYAAGDLADRANGVDQIQQLVSGAGVAAILGSLSGLFFVGQMFAYNLRLALLAVTLTLGYVAFTMTANYLQLRYQRQEIQLRGQISGLVLNLISGVAKLRISGAESHAFRVWAQQFATQRRLRFSVGTIQAVVAVFSAVFPVFSSIAIFYVVIGEQERAAAASTEGLTTGAFIAFSAAFGLFLAAMQALGDASLQMLRVIPLYERLTPILTATPEIDRSKSFPGRLRGEIELSHVHFRYHPDGPWIIKDLSLKISPGEFIAFVGGSGCGKSTLMRLMLGFEQPTSGSIFYDGQDLSSLDLRMLRQQIGVVLQVSRVMPTEIYRNIVGVSSRGLEEAWDAAEKAGLAEDIRQMPMGMHTYVSEGGGTLSGGQRQRLMIARAIVGKPKVIYLDEATSALDNRTQAIVTESLDKMEATRVVIAHRLSTVMNADRICYLEGGQIVEMGSYRELMERDGKFAELAQRQMA